MNIISIGSSMRDIFILNKDLHCADSSICHPFDPSRLGQKINVKDMYFDIGGGGSNSAATFANMGLKTALLSQIGDDLAGKEVLKVMKKHKVSTSLVQENKKEETGYSVIFISKSGDRTALVFRGASDFKNFSIKIISNKLKSDWLYIASLNGNLKLLKQLFTIAEKDNTKIVWNPGNGELSQGQNKLKSFLKNIHLLLVNKKEAQLLAKSKASNAKKLLTRLAGVSPHGIVCITDGKKGAWVRDSNDAIYHADIIDYKVVNTTGAGDAFGSGFTAGLILYNFDIKKSLQLAMLNSNNVVRKMGAKHGLLPKPPSIKMLNKVKVKIV